MHIVDTIYYWARTTPLRVALIEPDGIVTYASLANAIEISAEHFARKIVDRSRPVAVAIKSNSKMLVTILGLLRAGFDVILASKGLLEHLPSAGADTLVTEPEGAALNQGTNILFDDQWLKFGDKPSAKSRILPLTRTEGGKIICFTSGTTGRPRPVVCPEKAWQLRTLFPLNSQFANYERILVVPGLTNSLGLSRAYEALHAGRTACFAPFGPSMLGMIHTYQLDTLIASPQQILQLAEIQASQTRYPLLSLRSVQIGGARISDEGVSQVTKYLCRNVILHYGSTEAGQIAGAPYDMIADIPNAVGFVVPGMEVEIIDSSGRVLAPGAEGFVRLRSPVFVEHFAEAASKPLWFYSGDLGSVTENGVLCISGRGTDVLHRGGDKFSIVDFENFLSSCPGVKEAGVCSIMGDSGFEEVWVGIVLEPTVNLLAFRRELELDAKFGGNIDKMFALESIPRGDLGKIQRNQLAEILKAINEQSTASA